MDRVSEAEAGAPPPWSVGAGALGDGYVSDREIDPGVRFRLQEWAGNVATDAVAVAPDSVRREVRWAPRHPQIAADLLDVLSPSSEDEWERLLRRGATLITADGVPVRLSFRLSGLTPHGAPASEVAPFINVAREAESEKTSGVAMEVQSGNRSLVNDFDQYRATVTVQAVVGDPHASNPVTPPLSAEAGHIIVALPREFLGPEAALIFEGEALAPGTVTGSGLTDVPELSPAGSHPARSHVDTADGRPDLVGSVAADSGAADTLLSDVPSAVVERSYPWLAMINPLQALANCVLAAIAVDMSVRDGVGHQAPVENASPAGHLQRYAGRPLVRVATWEVVRAGMTEAGPGARGIVLVGGEDDRTAHAFNVVHDANGVVFLDGHEGRLARGPAGPHRLEFMLTAEGTGSVPTALLAGSPDTPTMSVEPSAPVSSPGQPVPSTVEPRARRSGAGGFRPSRGSEPDAAMLRAALPADRRSTVSNGDLVALERVRRQIFGAPAGAGLDSYAPLVWTLLGERNGVTPENLAALVDLVAAVRSSGKRAWLGMHRWGPGRLRFARTVTPGRLAAEVRSRRWSDSVRPLEGTPAASPEHNALVPGLQYIHDVSHLAELRDWLVSLLPVPGGVLSLETLKGALTWGFTAALDEGAVVEVRAGGVTYVVRILMDVTGHPRHEESEKPSARLETRVNVVDENTRSGTGSRSWYVDVGFAGRFGTRLLASFFGSAGGGGSRQKGRSFVLNNATAGYTYFKPSDPVASLAVPVAFAAVVTARDDPRGRWRYETWMDAAGAPRTETVRTYVGKTQLPRKAVVRTDLRGHPRRLPLWEMHAGVERMSGLRAIRAQLREFLGAEEYAFWADEIELFLGQDRVSGLVLDAYNPDPGFQEVPRLMLRSGDRYLNLALTAEATAVEKSGQGTKKVILDKIKAALTRPQAGRDRRSARRWGFIGNLRLAFGLFSIGARMNWSAGRGRQSVRSQKSYTLRAIRAADPSRVIKVDTAFTLTASFGNDGPATRRHAQTLPTVDGFVQVRVRQAEMSRTFDDYRPPAGLTAAGAPAETEPAKTALAATPGGEIERADAAPADAMRDQSTTRRSWWSPTPDGRHGLGYGTPVGVTGIANLYNSLVTHLLSEAMLPEAVSPEGMTPWEHLQGLDRTGTDLNGPGVLYANWRRLVEQVSDRVLTRRIDDLTSGTADEPGLTMIFTDVNGHSLTIGLSGVVGSTGRYQTGDDLWTLNSFSGQDGVAMRRTSAWTRDRTHEGSLVGDNGERELAEGAAPVGDAFSMTWGRRRGSRSGESVSGNAQSAAALEEHSSRFDVPMRLYWIAYREDSTSAVASSERGSSGAPLGGFLGSVRVWQGDSYSEANGTHQSLPELDRSLESSPLVGITPRAAVSVSGLAALRARMLTKVKGRLRVADVIEGFSATHYKANQMNGLQGGVAVLTGMERSLLQIEPYGRPQIVKKVRAYNDYTLESQTGDMRDADKLRTRLWRNVIGYGVGLPSDSGGLVLGGGSGKGLSTSGDRTAGSYRAWTGMNDLYVVRTAVRNRITFDDGTEVVGDGEVILMLATRDVHVRGHLDQYDDLFGLVPASISLSTANNNTRQPPRSVREGRPWTGVFLDTIGMSPLQRAVGRAGLRMGGPKLRIRLLQQLVGLMAHQSQLTDDGKAWEVRANGNTYQLWVKAELLDEADYVGEAARDRLKLYTRRNQASTHSHSLLSIRTIGAAGSKSTVGHQDDAADQALHDQTTAMIDDDVAAPVSGSVTGTVTTSAARGLATNMLTMTGERPQGAAQFNQPVKFSFELRRIDGVREALGVGSAEDVGSGDSLISKVMQRPESGSVTEIRTLYSLVDGSRSPGSRGTDLSTVQLGRLPANAKIHGIHMLAAIADTVSTGPRSERARPVSAGKLELHLEPQEALTADTLLTDFPAMQTAEGVSYQGINTGARRLRLPKGMTMTATFGAIRDAYHVRSAETEAYDHGTHGVTSTGGEARRRAVDGAAVVTAGVLTFVRVGGRGGGGFDATQSETFGAVRATEHRSWLRSIPRDGLYHIYADVALSVRIGSGDPRPVVGTIEFSVNRDEAIELGLTEDDLNRIREARTGEAPATDVVAPRAPTLHPILERAEGALRKRALPDGSVHTQVVPIAADQDCLFNAIAESASQQGIPMPFGGQRGRQLRDTLTALARNDPDRFTQVLDRTPAQILVADATADQLLRLLPSYTPLSPTAEKLDDLRTGEEHRQLRADAGRRGMADASSRPIEELKAELADFTPTITDERLGQLVEAYYVSQRREELAHRLTTDTDATVSAIHRTYAGAGDMPGSTALASLYAGFPGRLPTAHELVVAALEHTPLWNSALGDDTPYILAVGLGVTLAVVEDGRTWGLNPDGGATVFVRRGGNHFDALAPDPKLTPDDTTHTHVLPPKTVVTIHTSPTAITFTPTQPTQSAGRSGVFERDVQKVAPANSLAQIVGGRATPAFREALQSWLAADGWAQSQDFFEAHRDALMGADTYIVLKAMIDDEPHNDRLAAHGALLVLSRSGRAEWGFSYLRESDPQRRQNILLEQFAEADSRMLLSLADLSRGAVELGSERVDAQIMRAAAMALGGGRIPKTLTDIGHLPADNKLRWIRQLDDLKRRHADTATVDRLDRVSSLVLRCRASVAS